MRAVYRQLGEIGPKVPGGPTLPTAPPTMPGGKTFIPLPDGVVPGIRPSDRLKRRFDIMPPRGHEVAPGVFIQPGEHDPARIAQLQAAKVLEQIKAATTFEEVQSLQSAIEGSPGLNEADKPYLLAMLYGKRRDLAWQFTKGWEAGFPSWGTYTGDLPYRIGTQAPPKGMDLPPTFGSSSFDLPPHMAGNVEPLTVRQRNYFERDTGGESIAMRKPTIPSHAIGDPAAIWSQGFVPFTPEKLSWPSNTQAHRIFPGGPPSFVEIPYSSTRTLRRWW